MRRAIRLLLWSGVALASALAADGDPSAGAGIIAPVRVGIGPAHLTLTLNRAIEMAMRNNLDIAVERTNVDSAIQAIQSARGAFDPLLQWKPGLDNTQTPTPSLLDSTTGVVTRHSAGETFALHESSPWAGLSFDASFDQQRLTLGSPFVALNPFYVSQLTFAITQPLLRGRETDPVRSLVTIRSRQRDVSAAELEARAIDVAARTAAAYWDLVALQRQAGVNAEAVDLARTQLARDRRRIAAGSLASVELSAAEAELEKRLDDWYQTAGATTAQENALKTLLARDRRDPLWAVAIEPSEDLAGEPPEAIPLDDAVREALERRPELRELDSQLAANEIESRQNADSTKPRVNLVASYSLSGLAGTTHALPPSLAALGVTSALPPSASGGAGASLSSLFAGDYQSVQVGLEIDFTARNRAARANLAADAIACKRLELMRARAEQAVGAEVRNALQALDTARQRVRASGAASDAARQKLESESRLFATGESTNFLVLTRQNEYSDARRRQVEAQAALAKAVAQYQTATATILSQRQIRVAR
ncbi:MAG: TolC family protein [Bryobacteraceae bacterium]